MSQTPTARSIALVGSVSLTVGFALLIGYRPSALPDSLTEPLTQGTEALGDRRIVLLTGGLLAVIGLVGFGFWNGRDADTGFDTTSVETPTRDVSITGERLTTAFEQTANAHSAETPIEDALRQTLIALYTQDKQKQDAIRYVDGGDWTTDAVAAATLTTTNAADFPLWYRLYEWLYPTHAYDYRIQRTLQVVETHCAEATTEFTPAANQRSWADKLRDRLQTDTGGDS